MHPTFFRKLAVGALAALAFAAGANAKPVEAYYHALPGALDYGVMGYSDDDGNFVSLVGQQILGARAEVWFTPDQEADLASFRMIMVVPVTGAQSEYFAITGDNLVPMGKGKYYADLTSSQFNGVVRAGRFSIETYTLGEDGNAYALHGKLSGKTGFRFIVTKP